MVGNEEAGIAVLGIASDRSPSVKSVAPLHSVKLFQRSLHCKELSFSMFLLPYSLEFPFVPQGKEEMSTKILFFVIHQLIHSFTQGLLDTRFNSSL